MEDSSAEISGDEDNGFVSKDELLVVDSMEQNKELVCIEYPGSWNEKLYPAATYNYNCLVSVGGAQ